MWCNDGGLYRTDLATRQTVTLHTACSSRLYLHPTVSADGRTLIVQRTDKRAEDGGKAIYVEATLWSMNPQDGSNERKLEF